MAKIERLAGNARMSMGVVHAGTVYLSGQVATVAGGGSVVDQTREILESIDRLLAQAGTDKSHLLSCSLYVADIATLPDINSLWDRWVVPGEAPARTTIETRLASPRYALEIAVIAAVA
jgi:enamine deaminase RidA (YjgF/YER057c/UK114 family)